MAIPSSVCASSPKRYFRSCTFWLEIQSIMVLSIVCSHWVATQSGTCRFTCIWVALAWTAVSQTCLCTSSSVTATTGSWASALPINPMVTQSRMDFTVSMSRFEVILLRASVAALSHPFCYSMLKVNPTSDSTQQCQVVSKFGEVMM